MAITDYLTELVYAAAGALLGYLLMKMDDTINNKQYTYKEYSKFTLGCYLATLAGLCLLRIAGPVSIPGSGIGNAVGITHQTGVQFDGSQIPASVIKPPSIPSSGTAFFQPANGSGQSLRFDARTPTF
jgi:hypothetical protein